MLEQYGGELNFFSPLSDRNLPPGLDGIYFGGGYPELSAEALSANIELRERILKKSREGMPIYGECGGFMYLCRDMGDSDGKIHPMVGCFPFRTRLYSRLKSLGYREIRISKRTLMGDAGLRVRGHEFHYSGIEAVDEYTDIPTVFSVAARAGDRKDDTGYQVDRTLGSYIHLHFGSRPETAKNFVENCMKYKRERKAGK
jgi:cobyrinic acid a,c-diamide synthase